MFKKSRALSIISNTHVWQQPVKIQAHIGGGLEYLHRSPASHRSRQKENPLPGGVTGALCHWSHKYRDLVIQFGIWAQGWRPCYKNYWCWVQRRKNRKIKFKTNPVESCKEGCGSKRAILPMIIIIMISILTSLAITYLCNINAGSLN
jgi:hypothetical protein